MSFDGRSIQDLLAERRANCLEQHRESDATARALLQYHIDTIDREIARRKREPQLKAIGGGK